MINSLLWIYKIVLESAENKISPADKRDEAKISHRGTTRFPARANTQSFCNGNARPRLPQSFIPDAPKRNALPPPTDGSQPRPSSLSRFVAKSLTSSQQFITIHGGFHTTTKISIPQNPPVCKHKCRFFNTFGQFPFHRRPATDLRTEWVRSRIHILICSIFLDFLLSSLPARKNFLNLCKICNSLLQFSAKYAKLIQ